MRLSSPSPVRERGPGGEASLLPSLRTMDNEIYVYTVAGEPSGDLHASLVVRCLQERHPARFRGAAGPLMRAAGVVPDYHSDNWGTVSFTGAFSRIVYLWLTGLAILRKLKRRPPDVVMPVDFGAFNMGWTRRLHDRIPSAKILYYFPPGSWRPQGRDYRRLAEITDVVATPFAHSARHLRACGVNAYWVGHPVLDRLQPLADRAAFRQEHGLPPGNPVIGVLPGSRSLERNCLGAPLLDTITWLRERLPEATFLWSALPWRQPFPADRRAAATPGVTLVEDSATLMQASDLVITAMGTATLEAAAADCLPIAVYRGTWGMFLQWKYTYLARMSAFALPNILLGENYLPELLHTEVNPERLGGEVLNIVVSPERQAQIRAGNARVRALLGTPGASGRTAEMLWRLAHGDTDLDDLALPLPEEEAIVL